jgi:hypothetical protein
MLQIVDAEFGFPQLVCTQHVLPSNAPPLARGFWECGTARAMEASANQEEGAHVVAGQNQRFLCCGRIAVIIKRWRPGK